MIVNEMAAVVTLVTVDPRENPPLIGWHCRVVRSGIDDDVNYCFRGHRHRHYHRLLLKLPVPHQKSYWIEILPRRRHRHHHCRVDDEDDDAIEYEHDCSVTMTTVPKPPFVPVRLRSFQDMDRVIRDI